jgi:hypothetical protein
MTLGLYALGDFYKNIKNCNKVAGDVENTHTSIKIYIHIFIHIHTYIFVLTVHTSTDTRTHMYTHACDLKIISADIF